MATTDETILNGTSDDWQQQTYEVNWEQVTLEELTKGYMRQSDYTRKTQELKAQPQSQEEEEEDEAWKPAVKDAVRDDIYRIAEEIAEKKLTSRDFDQLLLLNPDLKRSEKAIRELSKTTWKTPQQVIDDYWFGSSEKLKKAKETRLLWDREYGKSEKPIGDMNSEEYAEWKSKNWLSRWSILKKRDNII